MRPLPLLFMLAAGQVSLSTIDVTTLRIGTPATVGEIDVGKLKGELRRPGGRSTC